MNFVLLTTRENQFGGVLGTAYAKAGGPTFSKILVVPERVDLHWSPWQRAYAAWKMLGPSGIVRMARIRCPGMPVSAADRFEGIRTGWIESIRHPDTDVIDVADINCDAGAKLLANLAPDVLVSIGLPTILKRQILAVPKIGCVNVHNGRLPKYRGHFGTFWEKFHGEPWGYVSLHLMASKVDAGRLLSTGRVNLADANTMLDVILQKKQLGGQLLAELLQSAAKRRELHVLRPSEDPAETEIDLTSHYFGWPKLEDFRRFAWQSPAKAA